MPHKLKKTRKQRGSRYMGWGQVGQHRKGGMRGGKGKAGGRKHFWIRTVKYDPDRYRKFGFKPPSSLKSKPITINIGELEGLITRKNDEIIDLETMGIEKLLGRGKLNSPLKVRVSEYSSKAYDKLLAAGGEILEI